MTAGQRTAFGYWVFVSIALAFFGGGLIAAPKEWAGDWVPWCITTSFFGVIWVLLSVAQIAYAAGRSAEE